MAALAGIYWTLRYSAAKADNVEGLELVVIAAVVFGGVSVFGGRGSIWGSVCGVLTIGVLNYALRLNRIPEVILVLVTGLLLDRFRRRAVAGGCHPPTSGSSS